MGPPVYTRSPREMFNVFGSLGTQAAIDRGNRILHKMLADLDIVHIMLLYMPYIQASFKILKEELRNQ